MVLLRRLRATPTLRLVLLLPLLATGVDVTRATLACGPGAETCLAAAGRGWMGTVAVVLVPLYAALFGVLLARGARAAQAPDRPPMGFARLCLLRSAGMGDVTAGQMLLARTLDGGAPLGGSLAGV